MLDLCESSPCRYQKVEWEIDDDLRIDWIMIDAQADLRVSESSLFLVGEEIRRLIEKSSGIEPEYVRGKSPIGLDMG